MLLSSARTCGARRCAILPRGVMLSGKLRAATPFYVLGQRTRGFLGDFDSFATINRGFRDIDRSEDFAAATFAFDPQRQRGLHGIFGTLKPAACDGLPNKILLLDGEVYLHASNIARSV
jgi:hypothetical protein